MTIDPAPEDILRQHQEAREEITTEELVRRYGKPTRIPDAQTGWQIVKDGKQNHIFCTMYEDTDPTGIDWGERGMHIINVVERYFFSKPLDNVYVADIDYGVIDENQQRVSY